MNSKAVKPLTREEIFIIAQKYSRLSDFRRRQPTAYNKARSMGIVSEVTQHMERTPPGRVPRTPAVKVLSDLVDGTVGRLFMFKTLSLVADIQTGQKQIPRPFGVCWLQEHWRYSNGDKT